MVSPARRGRDDLFYEWWPWSAQPAAPPRAETLPDYSLLYCVKLGRGALTQRKNEYPSTVRSFIRKIKLCVYVAADLHNYSNIILLCNVYQSDLFIAAATLRRETK